MTDAAITAASVPCTYMPSAPANAVKRHPLTSAAEAAALPGGRGLGGMCSPDLNRNPPAAKGELLADLLHQVPFGVVGS